MPLLTHFLDQPKKYAQKDPSDVYQSLVLLPKQYLHGWDTVFDSKIKINPKTINNICFSGMGGSGLPGRVIKSLTPFLLSLPFDVSTNYRLPSSVDKNSLVIISSYSGNTEETISALKDAINRRSQIFVMASGNELIRLAKESQLDYYQLDPQFNPCHMPRMGMGYLLGATLALLVRLNLISKAAIDHDLILSGMHKVITTQAKEVPTKNNQCKQLAIQHKGKAIFFIAANHLEGAAYSGKNLINETAKAFSVFFDLPELNHHLIEGLQHPSSLNQQSSFIFLNSHNYPKIIGRRIELTKDVIDRQKYPVTILKTDSGEPLSEVFETITFMYFFSYYLGLINGANPAAIPWVDYFKKRLKEI